MSALHSCRSRRLQTSAFQMHCPSLGVSTLSSSLKVPKGTSSPKSSTRFVIGTPGPGRMLPYVAWKGWTVHFVFIIHAVLGAHASFQYMSHPTLSRPYW